MYYMGLQDRGSVTKKLRKKEVQLFVSAFSSVFFHHHIFDNFFQLLFFNAVDMVFGFYSTQLNNLCCGRSPWAPKSNKIKINALN